MKYYIDCEFDGRGGPLLSMAIVAETGKSLYYIMNIGAYQPWVLENVIPVMADVPYERVGYFSTSATPASLAEALYHYFKGDASPHVTADWPDDIKYLCEALITGPGTMIGIPRMTFKVKRVDAYPTALIGAIQHNAWWDAQALRHLLEGKYNNGQIVTEGQP